MTILWGTRCLNIFNEFGTLHLLHCWCRIEFQLGWYSIIISIGVYQNGQRNHPRGIFNFSHVLLPPGHGMNFPCICTHGIGMETNWTFNTHLMKGGLGEKVQNRISKYLWPFPNVVIPAYLWWTCSMHDRKIQRNSTNNRILVHPGLWDIFENIWSYQTSILCPHIFPKKLVLQEIAYQTLVHRVGTTLYRNKKAIWNPIPLLVWLYYFEYVKHA
jgi:hypothetical protein